MTSFDQIYLLDLHGSARKKETAPDGGLDQNVFDIEQGVSISFLIKNPVIEKERRGIYHGNIWGARLGKYQTLNALSTTNIEWARLDPITPFYLFTPQDRGGWDAYNNGWSVQDIFPVNSVGIVTARDKFIIHYDEEGVWKTINDFAASATEEARSTYKLGTDVRDWRVSWAQDDIRRSGPSRAHIKPIHYRPFDIRSTYYTGKSRGFMCYPRDDVMRHLLRENIALITSRMTKGESFAHAQVSETISEVICMSPKTSNNGFVFPLWLYNGDRRENLSAEFREWIDARYDNHYEPEEILGLIYAVLYAQTYRDTYGEFLRIDFPRIPFPALAEDFERLSILGTELIAAHLMRNVPARGLGVFKGKGGNEVTARRFEPPQKDAETGKIWINDDQYFENVPPAAWEFVIGGYQVLDNYLKQRKGRTLLIDEIENVEKVVNVLDFTVEQMRHIDEAYRAAFPQGSA